MEKTLIELENNLDEDYIRREKNSVRLLNFLKSRNPLVCNKTMVKILIKKGVVFNKDYDVLYETLFNNPMFDVAKLLVKSGCYISNISLSYIIYYMYNENIDIRKQATDLIKIICYKGYDLVKYQKEGGNLINPLIDRNLYDEIEILLQNGADPNITYKSLITGMVEIPALKVKNIKMLNLLEKYGCDIYLPNGIEWLERLSFEIQRKGRYDDYRDLYFYLIKKGIVSKKEWEDKRPILSGICITIQSMRDIERKTLHILEENEKKNVKQATCEL